MLLRHTKVDSLVQHNAAGRIVDFVLTVVFVETELPEFIHEKIDARPRCTNHFRERLLRYFAKNLLRLVLGAITREHSRVRANRFSVELKSWSIRSSSTRIFRVSM